MPICKSYMHRVAILIASLLASAATTPLTASADVWSPSSGTGLIGQVAGDAWLGVSPTPGAACVWVKLGIGGLQQDLTLHGTSGSDGLTVVSATTNLCGFTFEPLVTNGWMIRIYAGDGNDYLYNRAYYNTEHHGEGGDDFVSNLSMALVHMYGNNGNDLLVGRENIGMWGEGGNDKFNVQAGYTAWFAYGGSGHDTICGNADYLNSVEVSSCP